MKMQGPLLETQEEVLLKVVKYEAFSFLPEFPSRLVSVLLFLLNFLFKIDLDLQNSCKDNTESSTYPTSRFPYR